MAKKKKKRLPPIPATKRKKKRTRTTSKKVTVRGKGSTPQKFRKIPDLVTGKFFVVTEDQKSVLNPESVFQPFERDNFRLFASKEAAQAELDKQRGLTVALPEEESFVKAVVAPVKQFMANDYDFDLDNMRLCCTLARKDQEPGITPAKAAMKMAKISLNAGVKDAAATLAAVRKSQAAEMRELVKEHARIEKDAMKEVEDAKDLFDEFQAKAKVYGA